MSELELALVALGREVEFPPTPDLAARVAQRLEPRRRPLLPRRVLALALAVLALAIGIAFAVPPARTAILDLFGFGGVTIQLVDRLPRAEEVELSATLGTPVTAAQVRHDLGFRMLLPETDAQLQIYEGNYGAAVLLATPQPVLLSEFRSNGGAGLLKKIAGEATRLEWVEVDGAFGLWLSGRPHVFIGPNAPPRVAGNVLLWQRGNVTLRLEGKLTKEKALEIARSVKPR